MLNPGDMIANKLRVTRQLGSGGMGVVYEAVQVHLGRRFAVKIIHPSESESQEARARFIREARAQAHLPLDHIVQVVDVDALPSGELYMVMEYLDGRDLKRELAKRGPLPVPEAVNYVAQACEGIAAAHDAGIVHRDLKPQNIFLTNLEGKRRVKILDFGVAKITQSAELALTSSSAAVGTPLYMSPEQLSGTAAIDGRSDLWALGVVLFELLTGKTPFKRETAASTLAAVLMDDPPLLTEVREDVPLGLEQVVLCCLAKAPDARFEDAREFAAALAPYATFAGMVSISKQAPRGSSAAPPAHDRPSDSLMMPLGAPRVPRLDEDDELSSTAQVPVSVVLPPSPEAATKHVGRTVDREAATLISRAPSPPRPESRRKWGGGWMALAGVALGAAIAVSAVVLVPRGIRTTELGPLPASTASAPVVLGAPVEGSRVPTLIAPVMKVEAPTVRASASASATPSAASKEPPTPRRPVRPHAPPTSDRASAVPDVEPVAGDAVPLHL